MSERFQDPMFLYAIAFVIFVALAFVYGRKPALGWVDAEIAKIRAELEQAYQLRAEAEAALADSKEKQAVAEAEAKAIIENAQQQVQNLRKQTEADLIASMTRQKQLSAERIRLAEEEAVADVRTAAVDLAMKLARKTLSENLSDVDALRLIDQAIADIPALKASKAKAA